MTAVRLEPTGIKLGPGYASSHRYKFSLAHPFATCYTGTNAFSSLGSIQNNSIGVVVDQLFSSCDQAD